MISAPSTAAMAATVANSGLAATRISRPDRWPGLELSDERPAIPAVQRSGGYRLARADRAHGLFMYANCGRFPSLPACTAELTRRAP